MADRFDQHAANALLVAIRAGASLEVGAAHAGVDIDIVGAWMEGRTRATREFAANVEKAKADLELLAVGVLRRSLAEDRGAAVYLLERMAAERELDRLRRLTT